MQAQLVKKYLLNKRAAIQWIEAVLSSDNNSSLSSSVLSVHSNPLIVTTIAKDEDFFSQLVDGVILCQVMQKIAPRMIPRIKIPVVKKRASHLIFKTNENVSFFLQACVEIGVPQHKKFVLHDLVQTQKTLVFPYTSARRILDCLETLCEVANKQGKLYNFHVKWPVLDGEKEKFSKDEIIAAEKMVEVYLKQEQYKTAGNKVESDSRVAESRKADRLSKLEMMRKQELDRLNKAATKLQALVKGWIARNRFRAMVRHQAYRDKVANEILTTERVYVEHLTFLFKQVLQPLRASLDTSSPILTENEIRSIFSDTEVLLNYNNLLLVQLEERVAKWGVHQRLGDIFLQIAGFLKIYSQYCSHYSDAMRTLGECKKQSKFKKFLEDIKKKNSDLEHRGLEDFLIRPVQRIPRYFLLLQDLVRHTSTDHPDYANLASAAQKVQAVAEYMNEKKREAENIMKVTEIQEMIDGDFEHPLAAPTRRFVKEAQLQEVTKGTTKKNTVVVFLFNDLLIITKSHGSSFLSRKQPKLQLHNTFELPGSQVISLDDTPAFPNAFIFMRKKSKRSITLLAASKEAKDEWVSAIEAEILGATRQFDAQDQRVTNSAAEKVDELKLALEKKMSIVVETQRLIRSSSDAMRPPTEEEIAAMTAAEDSPRTKSLSLKEKRMALMAQSKKNTSASGLTLSTVAVSTEK